MLNFTTFLTITVLSSIGLVWAGSPPDHPMASAKAACCNGSSCDCSSCDDCTCGVDCECPLCPLTSVDRSQVAATECQSYCRQTPSNGNASVLLAAAGLTTLPSGRVGTTAAAGATVSDAPSYATVVCQCTDQCECCVTGVCDCVECDCPECVLKSGANAESTEGR